MSAAIIEAPASEVNPLLELLGITKGYGHVQALTNVNFRIEPNEIVGLLGDNGAGKSTLVRIMSGVEFPDSGEIFASGTPAIIRSRKDSERLGIETIYQDSALVGAASIMRNFFAGRELTFGPGILDVRRMNSIVMDVLLNMVKITGVNSPDILVEALSGGQKQAVAIARAVYFKTAMLLLDEPTSALSVRETAKLLDHLAQLKAEGVSAVFITHNLHQAYESCDRFTVLSRGRVIADVGKDDTSVRELSDMIVKY